MARQECTTAAMLLRNKGFPRGFTAQKETLHVPYRLKIATIAFKKFDRDAEKVRNPQKKLWESNPSLLKY